MSLPLVAFGHLVQSTAGNFLLIVHWAIPCILSILPGTAGGPASRKGVSNARQALMQTNIIHTSRGLLLMRMDSVIDEQKEDEEKEVT